MDGLFINNIESRVRENAFSRAIKKGFTLIIFLLLSTAASFPQVKEIYVTTDGTGNGSKENPANFQTALDEAITHEDPVKILLDTGFYDASSAPFSLQLKRNQSCSVHIAGARQLKDYEGHPHPTILDGGASGRVLQLFANAEGANLNIILEHLIIRNGRISDDGIAGTFDHGAGLSVYAGNADSSGTVNLMVNNCNFENNETIGNVNGGAVALNCPAIFKKCYFGSNKASNGGAMIIYALQGDQEMEVITDSCGFIANQNYGNQGSSVYNSAILIVDRCEFKGVDDGQVSSGNGSAIYGSPGSDTYIYNSIFRNIKVKYWGSAFQTFGGNGYVYNSLFMNNKAGEEMGGDGYGTLAFYHSNQPPTTKVIQNCTFVGNRSRFPDSSPGGAIHNRGLAQDNFSVVNCIFWDNGLRPIYSQSPATVKYSLVQHGIAGSGFTDGGDNITVDPLISPDGIHPSAGSPCINTGTNAVDTLCEYDLDWNLRILSEIIDIGCFEYNSAPEDLLISVTETEENAELNSSIAYLSCTDADSDDIHNFRFMEGDGENDEDNALFVIEDSVLILVDTIDFENNPVLNILIEAEDFGRQTLTKAFVINVLDINDPVELNPDVSIDEQSVIAGNQFDFTFPENLFYDQDGMETISYTAQLEDGTDLPEWLNFYTETGTFSGVPMNTDVGTIPVEIIAEDEGGVTAEYVFNIRIDFNSGIINKTNSFRIYPNPASDIIFVDVPASMSSDYNLKIFDLHGRMILHSEHLGDSAVKINLQTIDAGVYILEVEGTEVLRELFVVE